MNRNLNALLVCFLVLSVAALMGCGPTDATTDPGIPDQDAQVEPDAQPDNIQPQPDADAQPEADSATPDSDAGNDVIQPEAQPGDADAGTDADAPQGEDADADPATDADAQAEAEAEPPDAADASDSDATQVETCVPPLPGDPCQICGAWSCDNKWRCSKTGIWENPNKSVFDCGDSCTPPVIGTQCAMSGEYACDPSIRCDCFKEWALASSGNFNCLDSGTDSDVDADAGGDEPDADVPVDADAASEAEAGSCPGECSPGWKLACDTSCGTVGSLTGLKTCGNDCKWGACVPPTETCNGKDDDCDGQKDNGFACAAGLPYSCHTQCDPAGQNTGTATCGINCQPGPTCQVPQENCGNTRDDDCDDKTDCDDEDCWGTTACPHDFGNCSTIPNGAGLTCDDPILDTIPRWTDSVYGPNQYMVGISSGCAHSSIAEQWAVGLYVARDESKVIHLSSGTTWSYVDLPFSSYGSAGWGNVACTESQTFFTLNKKASPVNAVLAKWNGSQVATLAEVPGFAVQAMWAASPTHIVFAVNKYIASPNDPVEQRVYTWDGTGLSYVRVDLYQPGDFVPDNMWGSGPNDVYMVGSVSDRQMFPTFTPAFVHWDGTSWAKIQIPSQITSLGNISGTSSCDVMAVGGSDLGFTLQRNGNVWQAASYTNLDSIVGVSKFAPQQYVLTGSKNLPMFLGTANGNFSENWRQVSGFFGSPTVTWIASTSPKVVMMADAYVNEAQIHRSACQ